MKAPELPTLSDFGEPEIEDIYADTTHEGFFREVLIDTCPATGKSTRMTIDWTGMHKKFPLTPFRRLTSTELIEKD